jgi:hypothetical protein
VGFVMLTKRRSTGKLDIRGKALTSPLFFFARSQHTVSKRKKESAVELRMNGEGEEDPLKQI